MPFKTLPEIIEQMLAVVTSESDLTDTNIGSNLRTLLEAGALQDADQHIQIARLKDIFSLDNAEGEDLDSRAEDFAGVVDPRFASAQSIGNLRIGDDRVTKKVSGTLASGVTGGVTTAVLLTFDAGVVFADFPASGSVIFERDSSGRELVAYSSKTGANQLNLAAPVPSSHASGTSVILSQQGADQAIGALTQAYVPATGDSTQIDFETTVASVLKDGEFYVDVPARSVLPGIDKNISEGLIDNTFQSKPFQHATVTNADRFAGGRDRETDDEFRDRIRRTIASLSRSTKIAIENAAAGVQLPSGQRVVTAQGVPPVIPGDEAVLYIDDGNGFSPTSVRVEAAEVVVQNAEAGQKRAQTTFWPLVTDRIRACRSTAFGIQPSGAPTISVATNQLTDSGQSFGAGFIGQTLVDPNGDQFTISAVSGGQLTLSGTPATPVAGQNYFIFDPAVPMALNIDYVCDYTTGAIEFNVTLVAGEGVVLARAGAAPLDPAYEYYDGLVREVQRVINGDPSDLVNYPGVKGLGVRVRVTTPQIVSIAISVGISKEDGSEDLLYTPIREAVLVYVNSRKIGQNVVNAQIVSIAQVLGASDTRVISPTGNTIILEGQLARTTINNISVT